MKATKDVIKHTISRASFVKAWWVCISSSVLWSGNEDSVEGSVIASILSIGRVSVPSLDVKPRLGWFIVIDVAGWQAQLITGRCSGGENLEI